MDMIERFLVIFGLEAMIALVGWIIGLCFYRMQLISTQRHKIRRIQAQAFLQASESSGIEEFLARSHKQTLKAYTKLTGRDRLVFFQGDTPEVQMMVLRAKFLEAEQAALANPAARHNYWGALQSLISPLLMSYSALDKNALTTKLRTITAQYNAQNARLAQLTTIEKQFNKARLKLKKAKQLIDRIKKINHRLAQKNQSEEDLDDAEVDLDQIRADQWNEDENYQSALELFDAAPGRSRSAEKKRRKSTKDSADDIQQVLIKESNDLVEQEIERLRYTTEEQRQTITVLHDELTSREGTMSEHDLIEARLKISKLENEITESETVISMLEDELHAMRTVEQPESDEFASANEQVVDESILTLKEVQITRLQEQLDTLMNNALKTDMSDVVEEKIAENDKLYADNQLLKMSIVKLENTLGDSYREKDKFKALLDTAMGLNTSNSRVISFALEITKQDSLSDIVKCVLDLANKWNLSVGVMAKLGGEQICQGSEGHFSKDDKLLIEEEQPKKKVAQYKNNLIIRGEGLSVVIHRYSVKGGSDPHMRDSWVILLGIAQKQIERVTTETKFINQKIVMEKIITATDQAVKNVTIQCNYHNNESKLIVNNLVIELNRSLSRVRLSAQEREQITVILNEAKDRFILLWETFSAIDNAFDDIFGQLKNGSKNKKIANKKPKSAAE